MYEMQSTTSGLILISLIFIFFGIYFYPSEPKLNYRETSYFFPPNDASFKKVPICVWPENFLNAKQVFKNQNTACVVKSLPKHIKKHFPAIGLWSPEYLIKHSNPFHSVRYSYTLFTNLKYRFIIIIKKHFYFMMIQKDQLQLQWLHY